MTTFTPTRAAFALLAAAGGVLIAGCAPTSPTNPEAYEEPAPSLEVTDPEPPVGITSADFRDVLAETYGYSAAEADEFGESVCYLYDTMTPQDATVMLFDLADSANLDAETAAIVSSAAILAYCPEHEDAIQEAALR